MNNVFQGKVKGAGIEVGRFLINSTAGLAGFFDLARKVDLVTPEEDFGQTLGFYGVKPGPYLVLPFLPPFTVRDFVGFVGDVFLNPINWLVAPIIEVNNVPSLIARHNRLTSSLIQTGSRVGEVINERSRNLEKFQESRKRRWISIPPCATPICKSVLRRFGSKRSSVRLVHLVGLVCLVVNERNQIDQTR